MRARTWTAVAVVALALTGCTGNGAHSQGPRQAASSSTSPYGESEFCRKAAEVINYGPDADINADQMAERARVHAQAWEELAQDAPSAKESVFTDVSEALDTALEAHLAVRRQGLAADGAALKQAQDTSYQLVLAWDTASQVIEAECGWPRAGNGG